MARRYEQIWAQLKKAKQVTVRCREEAHKTLIQGVMKEKSRNNAPRMALDLPSYGKMTYVVTKLGHGLVVITFRLLIIARAEDL